MKTFSICSNRSLKMESNEETGAAICLTTCGKEVRKREKDPCG